MFFSVAMIVLFVWKQPVQRRGHGRIDDLVPLNRRLWSCRLWVSRCRLPALRRTIFPLPVFVNRLLVPLCVFIFMRRFLLVKQSPPSQLMFRSDDHNQTASFHARSILDGAGLGQLVQ